MRFFRRSLIGLFLLAVTVGVLAFAAQILFSAAEERRARDAQRPPARERSFAVNVVPVRAAQVTPVLTAFGELRSRRTLDLRAKAGGTIIQLSSVFEDGGVVRAGQLLMQIDPSDARDSVALATSALTEARAEARDADRSLILAQDELEAARQQAALRSRAMTRQEDLRRRGVGTDAAVEDAELAMSNALQAVLSRRQALANAENRQDLAVTGVSRAQIALAEAERRLNDTALYAAFDGTLTEVSVVQGGLVGNNEQVARLVDPADLEVVFRVSTAHYARLIDANGVLAGARVVLTLDVFGTDLTATGQITRESPAVGEGQSGRLLFARLDAPGGMRPGDFVTVEVSEPPLADVAQVPASAVDAAGRVLALGSEMRLEEHQVTVLRAQGDDVLIRAPMLEGREIVAERGPLLGAGIKVRPLRPGAQEARTMDAMVVLTPERRARLITFVEQNNRMPRDVKDRLLGQLNQDEVPARTIDRLESRIGG